MARMTAKSGSKDDASVLPPWTPYYRAFGYFGLLSVSATMLFGFRYSSDASYVNVFFNLFLYVLYMLPHLVLTRSWYKEKFWGNPAGTPNERRVYISVAILGWLLVLILQRPIPGFSFFLPAWIQFVATVGFLFFFLKAFEGADFRKMDGLLSVPGSVAAFSHGPQTPLFTEGAYAQVRHPMYQAFLFMGLCTLLLHANFAQVFWLLVIGATFIGFIPIEEAQLRAARREDYNRYIEEVPWRLIPGVW